MYAILPNIIDFFLSKYFSCFRTVCWAGSWQPAGPWGELGPGVFRQISLRTPPSSPCPLPLQNQPPKQRACPCLAESRATSGPAASAGARIVEVGRVAGGGKTACWRTAQHPLRSTDVFLLARARPPSTGRSDVYVSGFPRKGLRSGGLGGNAGVWGRTAVTKRPAFFVDFWGLDSTQDLCVRRGKTLKQWRSNCTCHLQALSVLLGDNRLAQAARPRARVPARGARNSPPGAGRARRATQWGPSATLGGTAAPCHLPSGSARRPPSYQWSFWPHASPGEKHFSEESRLAKED